MVDSSQPEQPAVVSRWLKVTVALFAGCLALIVCDVILQLIEQPADTIRFQQDRKELNDLGMKQLADIVENDEELFWRLAPNTSLAKERGPFFGVIANRQGLREDHEIPLEKPKDNLRVLFLGDSCTFGYGLDHTEGYVDVAEQLLKKQLQMPVECINAGVPGYTLFQGLQLWKTSGNQLHPDIVVVCFGGNDMSSWDGMTDLQHHDRLKQSQPPGILRASSICRRLWGTLNRAEQTDQHQRRVTPVDFQLLLGKLHDSLTAADCKMVLLIWPFFPQVAESREFRTDYQQQMVSFAQQRNVLVLDLVPEFHKLADRYSAEALYLDQGHATALGNREIGELVAALLAKHAADTTTQP